MAVDVPGECWILPESGCPHRSHRLRPEYAVVADQPERRVFRVEGHERLPPDQIWREAAEDTGDIGVQTEAHILMVTHHLPTA